MSSSKNRHTSTQLSSQPSDYSHSKLFNLVSQHITLQCNFVNYFEDDKTKYFRQPSKKVFSPRPQRPTMKS